MKSYGRCDHLEGFWKNLRSKIFEPDSLCPSFATTLYISEISKSKISDQKALKMTILWTLKVGSLIMGHPVSLSVCLSHMIVICFWSH